MIRGQNKNSGIFTKFIGYCRNTPIFVSLDDLNCLIEKPIEILIYLDTGFLVLCRTLSWPYSVEFKLQCEVAGYA